MADKTDAFLAQLDEFRKLDFTGETTQKWLHGKVMEMDVKQRIRPINDDSVRAAVLVQPSSEGSVLDSRVGQP